MSRPQADASRQEVLKRALQEIKEMRLRLEAAEARRREPVAVIGMGCRLPGGVDGPESYWRLLRDGVDATGEVPGDRWEADAYYDPDPESPGKVYTRRGGYLERVDLFDAPFFSISPREAARMDPQQRLFLEVAWEALERAGQAPSGLAGTRTGVFVGVTNLDYAALQMRDAGPETLDAHTATGSGAGFVAGRISYLLGLQGPSMAVDTACSSSLVAVHLACQSLQHGESDLALAGGVNVLLMPELNVVLCRARMLSPDGRCKTFDASADGYARGEGCGVVALKRLADARRDGDPVLAVIRGSAVNQDGPASGLTVPSGQAQQAVIRQALESAGIGGDLVSYVEAHGTGTSLGDPIEVRALGAVLGRARKEGARLAVGSVKTNFGHLEAAAGVAGLLKAILVLQHREVPPHLHLREVNPAISLDENRVVIPTARTPLGGAGGRYLAGISSFGASGTNAHLVVEAAPEEVGEEAGSPAARHAEVPRLLALSAKSSGALEELAGRFRELLGGEDPPSLADVCFTAGAGRAHFGHRLAAVASTPGECAGLLEAYLAGRRKAGLVAGRAPEGTRPKVAFLFSGQGSQVAGMGRELYAAEPVFREALDRCAAVLDPLLERPLLQVMHPAEGEESPLGETAYTQPALFALQVALTELWRSWGVEPAAVLGHSVGEYAAAWAAGVLTLEEGLCLIAARGRIMGGLPAGGAMAAVSAGEERALAAVAAAGARVDLAAVNAPGEVVLSGPRGELERVLAALAADGVKSEPLEVSAAFHSHLLKPVLGELEEAARGLAHRPPRMPLVSNLTGARVGPGEMDAAYWRRHSREAVRFADGVAALAEMGVEHFVEIGPRPALLPMAGRCLGRDGGSWLPSLRERRGERGQMLASLAALYAAGAEVDWRALARDGEGRRVALPTYPFQRRRYWFDDVPGGRAAATPRPAAAAAGPLELTRLDSPALALAAVFELELGDHRQSFLADGGRVVHVGFYQEMLHAAAGELWGTEAYSLEGVTFREALRVGEGETVAAQLILRPGGEGAEGQATAGDAPFEIVARSAPGAPWTVHVTGTLRRGEAEPGEPAAPPAPEEVQARCPDTLDGAAFYESMRRRSVELGPASRWLDQVWRRDGEALARFREPGPGDGAGAFRWRAHPGVLDSAAQLFFAALPASAPETAMFMVTEWRRMRVFGPAGGALWGHVRLGEGEIGDAMGGDVLLFGADGRAVAELSGVVLRAIDAAALMAVAESGARRVERPGAGREALAAAAEEERPAVAAARLTEWVSAVFGFPAEDLDGESRLGSLGLDSLMALELKNVLDADFGVSLPLVTFIENPSIAELGEKVLGELGAAGALEPGAVAAGEAAPVDAEAGASAPRPPAPGGLPAVVPDPAGRTRPFPLSDLQEAYWVGRSGVFEMGNVATYIYLEVDATAIDVRRLEASWRRLIDRHDMLRAVILPDGRQQVQGRVPPYRVPVLDFRGLPAAAREALLADIRSRRESRVLGAGEWPLFEVRLTLVPGGVRLHIGLDALVCDAWGTAVLFREWARLYPDPQAPLPPLEVTFRDYVLGMEEVRRSPVYRRAWRYWEERIDGLPAAPELPLARQPGSIGKPRFVHRSVRLAPERWGRLKERAVAAGLTPTVAVCAAYAQVLAAWSKSRRFTLNVLFFNRLPLHPQIEEVVANFSSTILLEVDLSSAGAFEDQARRLQERLWNDLEHSQVSGVGVLRELNRRQGGVARAAMPVVFASVLALDSLNRRSPSGLFAHLLSLGEEAELAAMSVSTPQVWLDHQVMEEDGALVFNWAVVEDLFPPGMVTELFAAFGGLLERLADDAAAWRGDGLSLLPAEHRELIERVNATAAPVPEERLEALFLERAGEDPDRPAVLGSGGSLTYGELRERAAGVARTLAAAGAGPEALVAVVMDKGPEQAVATLGILLAGAAYLPVDPALPGERISHLLSHAGAELALTGPGAEAVAAWPEGVRTIALGEIEPADARDLPGAGRTAEELAYVIYTSGSTGLPKGVAIDHAGAVNTVLDVNRRFSVGPGDRVFALSSLSFDLSVYDLFGLFAAGGAAVIPGPGELREPERWLALLEAEGVTVWNSVPALLEMLVGHLEAHGGRLPASLRLVLLSGDWIPVDLPNRIRALGSDDLEVISLGGATEASIWSIFHPAGEVDPSRPSIPYGKPLSNQRFYVLDETLEPRPLWVPGELYIGGVGVARCYWRDEERTRASFVTHPATGERLYRTGDLGRLLPDGDIEFLGREDTQVKVGGYRIELGEIEAALGDHPRVRSGVVVAPEDERHGRRLVAYVVPEEEAAATGEELAAFLGAKLPEYMVPPTFAFVENLPLTANGKVDRGALAAPGLFRSAAPAERVAPRDALERELAALWEEILEVEPVGVTESFFELGGHSLMAVRLMARIGERYGRQLPLSTLFGASTVETLARVLRGAAGAPRQEVLVPIQPRGEGRPFFCVHPVGGSVMSYVELARLLGEDQPFYGLQLPAGDGGDAPGIAELAARYVREVTTVQPRGPWRLGGWSLGGVVAFEMARLLTADGGEVELLALVDAAAPAGDGRLDSVDDATFAAAFARDLAGLAGSDMRLAPEELRREGEEPLARVLELAREGELLPRELTLEQARELFRVFQENLKALARFEPRPYPGGAVLFRAAEPPDGEAPAPDLGWTGLAAGGLTVHTIPGDHYSILRRPGVDELAARLRDALERTRSEPQAEPVGAGGARTSRRSR